MSPKKLIPFIQPKGKKESTDGEIIDHGDLGSLEYEVYKRGVIHIFGDGKKFKKDMALFEDDLNQLDFGKMKEGDDLTLRGSGDNADIVFTLSNGDISITLKEKGFPTLEKLKNILKSGSK
jgi:hypothetical protein